MVNDGAHHRSARRANASTRMLPRRTQINIYLRDRGFVIKEVCLPCVVSSQAVKIDCPRECWTAAFYKFRSYTNMCSYMFKFNKINKLINILINK